jgi:hypothetical protein
MEEMMKGKTALKFAYGVMIAALAVATLVGCSGGQATSASAGAAGGATYTSAVLDTSYPDALNVSNQLALGTILLEETDQAVMPEQAATLLPLWQVLRGGVTTQVEVNAVLKQIEGTMTREQLEAIAAMQLTQEYLQTWMQEQGMGSGFPGASGGQGESSGALATRRAGFEGMSEEQRATAQAGGGMPGGPAGFEGMSEEQRQALMATMQAGGGTSGGRAGFEGMSEEEREALRATAQAGGGMSGTPGGRRGASGGQSSILLEPLIELLQARAGGA